MANEFKIKNGVIVTELAGAPNSLISTDSTGKLVLSGIDKNFVVLNTTLASITGNLQSQINGKANLVHTHSASAINDFNEAVDDRVGSLLVAGSNITITYNDVANQILISSTASVSGGGGGATGIQGRKLCDIGVATYTIIHDSVNPLSDFPVATLEVPMSGSNLMVAGIYDRTPTSFKVELSDSPPDTGYAILWHISSQMTGGYSPPASGDFATKSEVYGMSAALGLDTNLNKNDSMIWDGDSFIADPQNKTFTYYLNGDLESVVTSKGTRIFTYDIAGNLINISGSGAYSSKNFTYDIDGNLTGITLL